MTVICHQFPICKKLWIYLTRNIFLAGSCSIMYSTWILFDLWWICKAMTKKTQLPFGNVLTSTFIFIQMFLLYTIHQLEHKASGRSHFPSMSFIDLILWDADYLRLWWLIFDRKYVPIYQSLIFSVDGFRIHKEIAISMSIVGGSTFVLKCPFS